MCRGGEVKELTQKQKDRITKDKLNADKKILDIQKIREKQGLSPLIFGREPKHIIPQTEVSK